MKHPRKVIRLLTVLCIFSVAAMVIALLPGDKAAAFSPPPFDAGARQGSPEVPEELGYQILDAGVFRAGLCGAVIPNGHTAHVWFTNPEENTVWLRLRILDEQGNILGQTGLLRPGEYLQTVTLDTVPPEGASIRLKLMAYEPETYHAAGSVTVSTTITQP